VVLNATPPLAAKTLRSRGAAAADAFFLSAGGERRCVVPSRSSPASERSVEFSFPRRERRSHVRPHGLESLSSCGHSSWRAGVQGIRRRCAGSFGRFCPLCSTSVARVESVGVQRSRGWGGSVAGAHNTRLQRTVICRHVRACGAHDIAARGR
jgi:hypothetical protein